MRKYMEEIVSFCGKTMLNVVISAYGNLPNDTIISIAKRIGNVALRKHLDDEETLSEELVDRTVSTFLQQVEDGTWTSNGWPQNFTDHLVSKLAVNAYTRLMAGKPSEQAQGHQIYINCYCPGWVKTAVTGYAGNNTAGEGADTAVWLALLPDQSVSGKFFAERREIKF